MPLCELRTAELFLVATLRFFQEARHGAARHDWREGFLAADVSDSTVKGFLALFAILAAEREPDIAPSGCRMLSADEGRVLQLVAMLQRRHAADALVILQHWLAPAAARLALKPARALAEGLADRGLIVPPRHRADVPPAFRGMAPPPTLH